MSKNQKSKPEISVVIPTYNEEARKKEMNDHFNAMEEYFEKIGKSYEILVVLDGPTEKTPELVREQQSKHKNVRVVERKKNKGKGYTVREGLTKARGKIRIFTDMDGATPIHMLDRFLPKFNEGADIVIGSRELEGTEIKKHQPKIKEWLGNMGNVLIQAVTGLWGMKDTQCGFKAFREKVVEDVIPRMTVNRWGIDFELLMVARKRGYKIEEAPVEWIDAGESLVGISGYFMTLRDLFKVKWNMILGKYKLGMSVEDFKKNNDKLEDFSSSSE